MTKKTIIIGNHPLKNDLVRQYEDMGGVVVCKQDLSADAINMNEYDELCLLAGEGEDYKAVALLEQFAITYDVGAHCGKKLVCHLLLQSVDVLRMLQMNDFCKAVREKIDVYPFTMEEVWGRSIVWDYEPVSFMSDKHVHVVIYGMGQIAEMVAIQVALVAHYPNYIRNHQLRTRITMIDDEAELKSKDFTKRYQHLFDNSYYRIVKPSDDKPIVRFHKPMYEGKREDFVDVEWEFVEAEEWNADLREKLKLWANAEKQLLTIVLVDKDGDKNKSRSLLLPQELYDRKIPIHIYSELSTGYDVTLPLVSIAKNVNYIYDKCYEENDAQWNGQLRHAVEIDWAERERSWARLKNVKRQSSIYNAMTIASKMRSIGLDEGDWTQFYSLSQQDIELLGQVEHNRWSIEELILGFRPCTDEEDSIIATDVKVQKNVYKARKIHYDLRAYHDLRPDGTGKPVQVYDLCLTSCLPLIAKAFADEKGGEE